MGSPVIHVAKIVAYLTMIVIIYSIMFSDYTNELYWEGINTVSNNNWNMYTLEGGSLREEAYSMLLDNSSGDTYSAVD